MFWRHYLFHLNPLPVGLLRMGFAKQENNVFLTLKFLRIGNLFHKILLVLYQTVLRQKYLAG